MKKIILLLVTAFVLCSTYKAQASHIMGADLTYTCTGAGTYTVKLAVYRDCNGIAVENSYSIYYSSVQCGVTSSITLNPYGSALDITPICPALIDSGGSACSNSGGMYGVQKYVFTGTLTLPVGCGSDWILSWTNCCRNGAITNLSNPLNDNIYLTALLDNTQTPGVSSPVFLNNPIPFFCLNEPVNYNNGVIDVNGDSLVFLCVPALNSANSPVVYAAGYTYNQPFNTLPGDSYTFNSFNGEMHFTPAQQQVGVNAITAYAYRHGQLVSAVTRDMEFIIIQCSQLAPWVSGFGGSLADSSYYISIPACVDTCLQIFSGDSLPVQLAMNWNGGISSGSYSQDSAMYPTGNFCWTPTLADTGWHIFTVTLANTNCPLVETSTYAYSIFVTGGTATPASNYSLSNNNICTGDTTFVQLSQGAQSISITPATGLNWLGNNLAAIAPDTTTTYTITWLSACSNYDTSQFTITVTTPVFNAQLSADTICNGDSVYLSLGVNSLVSITPNLYATVADSADVVLWPDSTTTYTLIQLAGCGKTDTSTFTILVDTTCGIHLLLSAHQVCGGDSVVINVSGDSSFTITPANNIVWINPNQAVLHPDTSCNYKITGSTAGHSDSLNFNVQVFNNVPLNITSSKTKLCSYDTAQICIQGGFASYNWSGGQTSSCIYTTAGGTFTVTVAENNYCAALSDSIYISIDTSSALAITIHGDTLAVSGGLSWQWYVNADSITGANSSSIIANTAGAYTVQATDANGCMLTSTPAIVAGLIENAESYLHVFPNPTTSGWQLEINDAMLGSTAEIFDAGGRCVFKTELQNNSTSLTPVVSTGVYVLRITSAHYTIIKKLVRL